MTDDEEVMAWWKAVKEEGHPDIKEGWPVLDSVAALQDILASIMWVSSGHHAGVFEFPSCQPFLTHTMYDFARPCQRTEITWLFYPILW